ncbi:MAG: hypothetical protein R2705_21960 [Ilumatobacteraceae bacterium]
MDFSKFKTSDWMIVGGGAAFVISGFVLDWASIDTPIGSYSGGHAFDWFFTGGLALIIAIVAATLTVMRVMGTKPLSPELPLTGRHQRRRLLLDARANPRRPGVRCRTRRGDAVQLRRLGGRSPVPSSPSRRPGGMMNDLKDLDKLETALAKVKPKS